MKASALTCEQTNFLWDGNVQRIACVHSPKEAQQEAPSKQSPKFTYQTIRFCIFTLKCRKHLEHARAAGRKAECSHLSKFKIEMHVNRCAISCKLVPDYVSHQNRNSGIDALQSICIRLQHHSSPQHVICCMHHWLQQKRHIWNYSD